MRKLKLLTVSIFLIIVVSFLFFRQTNIFSALLIVADALLLVTLFIFLSNYKKRTIGKIIIEHIHYPLTFVLRAYTKPKNLWITYDYNKRRFTPAGWSHLPLKAIFVLVLGAFLLYVSYMIMLSINQAIQLIFFRGILLFIFFLVGIYSLLLGLYRIASIGSKKAELMCKLLNRQRFLLNRIQKGSLFVQITPNFLIKEGFVNSVEFIMSDEKEVKELQKILLDISRKINKL